jgi:hypothetical protein
MIPDSNVDSISVEVGSKRLGFVAERYRSHRKYDTRADKERRRLMNAQHQCSYRRQRRSLISVPMANDMIRDSYLR